MPNNLPYPSGSNWQFIVTPSLSTAPWDQLVNDSGTLEFLTSGAQTQIQLVVGTQNSGPVDVDYTSSDPNNGTITAVGSVSQGPTLNVVINGQSQQFAFGVIALVNAPQPDGPVTVAYGSVNVNVTLGAFLALPAAAIIPKAHHYSITDTLSGDSMGDIHVVANGVVQTVNPAEEYGTLITDSLLVSWPTIVWQTQTSLLRYAFTGILRVQYAPNPPWGLAWAFGGGYSSEAASEFGGTGGGGGDWTTDSDNSN